MSVNARNPYPKDEIMRLAYKLIPMESSGKKLTVAELIELLPNIGNYNKENVRKQIRRAFETLNEEAKVNTPLIIKGHGYCWRDTRSRDKFAGQYSETPESKAIVYDLMFKHFGLLLPPKFRKELRSTYESHMREVSDHRFVGDRVKLWQSLLIVNPLGFPLIPSIPDDDAYELIYNAVENKLVLKAEYRSIHAEVPSTHVIFSPHKIILQNLNLYVLAVIRNEKKKKVFKLLSLEKLKNVSRYDVLDETFANKKLMNFRFSITLRVHDFVKDYFEVVKLSKDQKFEKDGDKCWLMQATIEVPQHFRNEGADIFYLCNFLGSFSHAVEVISPVDVRAEMKMRTECMLALYNAKGDGSKIMDDFVGEPEPIDVNSGLT